MTNWNVPIPFHDYYGKLTQLMPYMIANGCVPIGFRDLSEQRLANIVAETKGFWWGHHFTLGDGIFSHPEGNVKIALDSPMIRGLSSETPLSSTGGALVLGKTVEESVAAYDALENVVAEFTKKDIETMKLKEKLSAEEAKEHPIWQALVNYDQFLLNEVVDGAFRLREQIYGSTKKMMTVKIRPPQEKAVGYMWVVCDIDIGSAAILENATSYGAFLVGKSPEMLDVQKNYTSQTDARTR